MNSRRIRAIDVARGGAMFFVCLSHFAANCMASTPWNLRSTLQEISMIASPSFMLISGIILGFHFRAERQHFAEFRVHLADRALLLLTLGHVLLLMANVLSRLAGASAAFTGGYITDAIATAALVGPVLVVRLPARRRAVLAPLLLLGSWVVVYRWQPSELLAQHVKNHLVGSYPPYGPNEFSFPLLPWISCYLVGTILGEDLGRWRLKGRLTHGARRLFIAGSGCAFFVVLVKVISWLTPLGHSAEWQRIWLLHGVEQKWPPSPFYFLFFGGIGLAMISALIIVHQRFPERLLPRLLAIVGQSSFVIFIVQAYLYKVVPRLVGAHGIMFWLVYFVATLGGLTLLAHVWQRREMNRVLTVGLPRVVAWYRERALELRAGYRRSRSY